MACVRLASRLSRVSRLLFTRHSRLSSEAQSTSTTASDPSLQPSHPSLDHDPAVAALHDLDLTQFRPLPPPAGSVEVYARYSTTLQRLLLLGVSLHRLSAKPEVIGYLLRADFDLDVAPIVHFLTSDIGLDLGQVGSVLTRCPEMLLDGKEGRMMAGRRYLQQVGFESSEIATLTVGCAQCLVTPPEELDFFFELLQQTFFLTGSEVRQLVLTDPLVLTVPPTTVRLVAGTFKKSFGFSQRELAQCVISAPTLLRHDLARCGQNFTRLYNRHGVAHPVLAASPQVLLVSPRILRERLHFLTRTGRAQFDPSRPLFTPPSLLAASTDEAFCDGLPCGTVTVGLYDAFLRSL